MSEQSTTSRSVFRAAAWSAKFLVPATVVAVVLIATARIKHWSIVPFIAAEGAPVAAEDWCSEHAVPEAFCTLCHPELENSLVMCGEHGLPEALCTLCHPERAERYVVCEEHNLPEAFCTTCNPSNGSLAPADWCLGHGVPESQCTQCNPQLQYADCSEHGVPEPLCTQCYPELAERFPTCEEHGLPPAFCPVCREGTADTDSHDGHDHEGVDHEAHDAHAPTGALLPKGPGGAELCRLSFPLVQLPSPQTMADAGIEVAPVENRALSRTVNCNGIVKYAQNQYAPVRPRVEGIITEVLVDVGTRVERGDTMAVVDSQELGAAKADYLSALAMLELAEKNRDRLASLADRQILPGKALIEAESRLTDANVAVARAKQRLQNLGLAMPEIEQLQESRHTNSRLPITAPLSGVVIRREVAAGEAVTATSELFVVADLSTMWAQLQVPEDQIAGVRTGQEVAFAVDSIPGEVFRGEVTWVSAEVHPQTRMVHVRAELDNSRGLLRSGMYGKAEIQVASPKEALLVPKTAIQWHEGAPVVFVRTGEQVFEPRRVNVGHPNGAFRAVTAGVKPGEQVATTGAFLLKTELQRGAIGAACCGE